MNNLSKYNQLLTELPKAGEWMLKRANDTGTREGDFASSLLQSYLKYGRLSEKQLYWADKNYEKMKAKERGEDEESSGGTSGGKKLTSDGETVKATEETFPNIVAMMTKIQGIKNPSVIFKNIRIKLTTHARNPRWIGTIFIDRGSFGTNVGMMNSQTGELTRYKSKGWTAEDDAAIRQLEADPLQQLMVHGKELGRCMVCSRELSNDGSIEMGIGPICYARMMGEN